MRGHKESRVNVQETVMSAVFKKAVDDWLEQVQGVLFEGVVTGR